MFIPISVASLAAALTVLTVASYSQPAQVEIPVSGPNSEINYKGLGMRCEQLIMSAATDCHHRLQALKKAEDDDKEAAMKYFRSAYPQIWAQRYEN